MTRGPSARGPGGGPPHVPPSAAPPGEGPRAGALTRRPRLRAQRLVKYK